LDDFSDALNRSTKGKCRLNRKQCHANEHEQAGDQKTNGLKSRIPAGELCEEMVSVARHPQPAEFAKVVSADQIVVNRQIHLRLGDVFESIAVAAVLHERIVRSRRQGGPGYENENPNEELNAICHFASRLNCGVMSMCLHFYKTCPRKIHFGSP
jgi:hypothetical protein